VNRTPGSVSSPGVLDVVGESDFGEESVPETRQRTASESRSSAGWFGGRTVGNDDRRYVPLIVIVASRSGIDRAMSGDRTGTQSQRSV